MTSDICPALTPHRWNMPGLCVSTYELRGISPAKSCANRTSARAAQASSVVARTTGAYQQELKQQDRHDQCADWCTGAPRQAERHPVPVR